MTPASPSRLHPLPGRPLLLGTLSFALCFAAWGLVSAFAPRFREQLGLTATQTSLLVALPVLLGSLARIPVGLLADRFGGRAVFTVLMLAVAVPAWLLPAAVSLRELLWIAFFLGLAGASFPIGVGFVSRWTPASRQGSALGLYGLGQLGQSAAVFLGPVLALAIGRPAVFRGMAALLAAWAVTFALVARDAPSRGAAKGFGDMLRLLARERLAWALSLFYFLTFGGFVAFAIYLPSLLKDQFGLSAADAGFRAAGFVVLCALTRPVGGWLSDRLGGARVLAVVFFGVVPFALLLTWPAIAGILPFTVGALGCAALLGLGCGAVFKLVPELFPNDTATVTGLVGAMGGLGGFFPPLALGFFRDRLGAVWPGFVLLAATAGALGVLNHRLFLRGEAARQFDLAAELPAEWRRGAEGVRAGLIATLWTGFLVAAIVVGSRNLQHFDPALVVYTFAIVFATWGVAYHYAVWIRKPPTRIYWRRGWELFFRRGLGRGVFRLVALTGSHLLGQGFIRRRSPLRWWMHQLLFWGCLLAAAITFPLVFGWIHFETPPAAPATYVTYLFGFPVGSFPLFSVVSWAVFHGLDLAALLVLGGISLSLWRRLRDRGALAVQSFGRDFLPLILLFAISVTGLALTASTLWLRGSLYPFLALLHAATVIAALLFLPFGKFFHVFQRPAQLGVKLYQEAGEEGEAARCARCGEPFASRMHVEDLGEALRQLGFDYRLEGADRIDGSATWQGLCPPCKRKSLAAAQLRLMAPAGVSQEDPFG
jgi:NNP family nitrate/nitrite transporter-like MFS transporter